MGDSDAVAGDSSTGESFRVASSGGVGSSEAVVSMEVAEAVESRRASRLGVDCTERCALGVDSVELWVR